MTAPPPPGAREQLPARILALLTVPPYLSTACETARLVSGAIIRARDDDPALVPELEQWRDRMHARCRINHKYTGRLCICPCHWEDPT